MFITGKIQRAYINRFSNYGAFLSDEPHGENEVLLPNRFVTDQMRIDDELSVFIYRDSEKRLTATTQKPHITIGEIECLKVVEIVENGCFLDINLHKDLFLPRGETKGTLALDETVCVMLLLDAADQLYATMKIYDLLEDVSPYKTGDSVKGIIYELSETVGAFVAVDNKYHGLIPKQECYADAVVGAKVEARVTKVRENDQRLNLSLREKKDMQIYDDKTIIINMLMTAGGSLPFHDKSSPEEIRKTFNMSKKSFKRAIGMLKKENKIELFKDHIQLIQE